MSRSPNNASLSGPVSHLDTQNSQNSVSNDLLSAAANILQNMESIEQTPHVRIEKVVKSEPKSPRVQR